jgi:tRNA(Ile)-lysidine synthase TilS/MesJ
MRRGYLYKEAQKLGCNKIALGHHFDDVIETILMGMLYAGQYEAMMPKLHSTNFPGMELIRPLYRVRERDIQAFARYHGFTFLQCACPLTKGLAGTDGKRREIKELIAALKKTNPDIEVSIFNSLHAVEVDTFPGWKSGGEKHSFTERYPSQDGQ